MTQHRTATVALATLAVALVAALSPVSAHAATMTALVRTPSALGPPTPQNLALSDGTLGPLAGFNLWQETSAGVYTITFPNMSSLLTTPTWVHVSRSGGRG
jgi:hypothetical protein